MDRLPEHEFPVEQDEKRTALDNWRRFRRAYDAGHDTYLKLAKKCDEFYVGDQWSKEDKQRLDEQGRPALTINEVLSTVNTVLGEQADRRADIQYKPVKGGTEETAKDLNKIYKHVTNINNFHEKESDVFADGIIQERGFFDVRMEFDDNILGEIAINTEDNTCVVIDPEAKSYDPSTWNEVFIYRWMTIDDIEIMYGKDKAEKLRVLGENGWSIGSDSVEFERLNTFGDVDEVFESSETAYKGEHTIRSVRVIERQYRKLDKVVRLIDMETGDSRIVPKSWGLEKAQEFAARYGLQVTEKAEKRVRMTITADHVVMHDDWSIYPTFTIIPYFPYFRRGRGFGLVRNLIDPQELLNKVSSQELHIVNTTANSGWVVEDGSLSDMDEDELEEHGAKTGAVIKYKRGYAPPEKIKPNAIPQGVDRISMKAEMSIRSISGVNESLMGLDKAEVSGVAMSQKTARGQIQLKVPLENLRRTRRMVAQKILELVQLFYTESRLIYITDDTDPFEGRESYEVNQEDDQGNILNDVTRGKYDVVIGTMPSRDSHDELQFAQAMQLREMGVAIPDHFIVHYSHLTNKADLEKLLKDMQGFGEMTPEQQQMMQMQQQLQLETAQSQLDELRAKAENLRSQSMLNAAKASELDGSNKVEEQLRQIESQIQMKELELGRRLQMSLLGHKNSQVSNEKSNATKLALGMMNYQQKERETSNATNRSSREQ